LGATVYVKARAFMEQFGGEVLQPELRRTLTPDEARRIAANIAKLPELLRKD
jgi:hypothetical protein